MVPGRGEAGEHVVDHGVARPLTVVALHFRCEILVREHGVDALAEEIHGVGAADTLFPRCDRIDPQRRHAIVAAEALALEFRKFLTQRLQCVDHACTLLLSF
jgi:hypothetical protein